MYPAQHHILKLRLGTNSPQVPGDSWGGSRCLCLKVIWLSWPSLPCDPPPANSHRHSGTPKLRRRRRRRGEGGGTKAKSIYLHLIPSAVVWAHTQQHTSSRMCSKQGSASFFWGSGACLASGPTHRNSCAGECLCHAKPGIPLAYAGQEFLLPSLIGRSWSCLSRKPGTASKI